MYSNKPLLIIQLCTIFQQIWNSSWSISRQWIKNAQAQYLSNSEKIQHTNSYQEIHKKSYNTLEEVKRLSIFTENSKKTEEHNKRYTAKKVSYKLGVNQFADLTHEEFLEFLKRSSSKKVPRSKVVKYRRPPENVTLPETVDWRDHGAVTPVKDQGQCGSCWSFSVTGTLESFNFLKRNKLVRLSEQELVDCDSNNSGCSGGLEEPALDYVINNGLASEEDYPYEAEDGRCRRHQLPSAVQIDSYVMLPSESEDDLQIAVATKGPVSVAMDASNWQLYDSGVFYDDLCENMLDLLNHAILAVGYGTEGSDEHWLVKNEWGENWGENGYIRTARNRENNCGIATDAVYPNVL